MGNIAALGIASDAQSARSGTLLPAAFYVKSYTAGSRAALLVEPTGAPRLRKDSELTAHRISRYLRGTRAAAENSRCGRDT